MTNVIVKQSENKVVIKKGENKTSVKITGSKGDVGVSWRGDYEQKLYGVGDAVSINNKVYVCLSSTSENPESSDKWQLLLSSVTTTEESQTLSWFGYITQYRTKGPDTAFVSNADGVTRVSRTKHSDDSNSSVYRVQKYNDTVKVFDGFYSDELMTKPISTAIFKGVF